MKRTIFTLLIFSMMFSVTLSQAAESTKKKTKKDPTTDDRSLAVVDKNRDGRKRVALVIGNSSYRSSPLKNPINDARTMAATLRRLGFEVEERTDLGYIPFNEAVENFGKKLRTGGVGLFYYAGHGMQVNGANYLIPIDAKIESENEVRYKAVDAGLIMAKMEQAKSDVNIVVLDACRDNPFSRSFRSGGHGLASIDAPTGTIISYATAPGKTASDGEDRMNGLFTAELVKAMETPGLKVEDVFKQVRKAVREKSANAQIPWESSSLEGNFHFVAPNSLSDLQLSADRPQQPVTQTDPIVEVGREEEKQNISYNADQKKVIINSAMFNKLLAGTWKTPLGSLIKLHNNEGTYISLNDTSKDAGFTIGEVIIKNCNYNERNKFVCLAKLKVPSYKDLLFFKLKTSTDDEWLKIEITASTTLLFFDYLETSAYNDHKLPSITLYLVER